jgi:hypothetical protein
LEAIHVKLEIELVPSTAWNKSLYNILPVDDWSRIKSEIYAKEGHKCYVCGKAGEKLEAHEFWEYDDRTRTQKLVGIHHLCDLCHKIKHLGFWLHTEDGRLRLKQQGLTRNRLIEHFCKVNGCQTEDFLSAEKQAFRVWEFRSKHEWKQDFGKYSETVRPYL